MSSVSPTELANLIEERVVRVGLILWPNCVEVIIDNNGRLCRLTDILQLSHTDYRILYDKIFDYIKYLTPEEAIINALYEV